MQKQPNTNPAVDNETLVDALLNDRTYHIEFNGGLSNHDKHAVIALHGLGASPARIKSYYDAYAIRTPYGYALEPPKVSRYLIRQENWDCYLGKRTSFSSYCNFFDQQEKELGLASLLQNYAPKMISGWVGALTHATIHLGWALDIGHRWMIIEGLAYMAFSYVSCNPTKTFPATNPASDRSVLDSLLHLAAADEAELEALKDWVKAVLAKEKYSAQAGFHTELVRTELQHKIAAILAEGHPLIHATPAWIEAQDIASIWEQLYYAVTLLYLSSRADFVVLHLITSLYAMEQIAKRMSAEEQRHAIKCFWTGMLGIVFAYGAIPTKAVLQGLNAKYESAVDPGGRVSQGPDWPEIVARAVTEEEEHNPKLVYVQQRMWQRYGYRSVFRDSAACFTTTPKLPIIFDELPIEGPTE